MEPFKNLSFDFNRVLLQLLIPGATAIFPYFIFFHKKFIPINLSESVLVTIFFLASIAAGLILEDIGSRIEHLYWEIFKKRKSRKCANGKENEIKTKYDDEWDQYLNLTFEENKTPIIVRYIRTLYIRLKFELSFGVAILIMTLGFYFLNYYEFLSSCNEVIIYMILLPLIIAGYCLFEAYSSVVLMAKNRSSLIKNIQKKL